MTHILSPQVLQNTGTTLYDDDRVINGNTGQMETNKSENWVENLEDIYDEAVSRYQKSQRGPDQVIPESGLLFLESIGTTAQELYDFVEDWVDAGEPPFSTVAAITEVRREYFLAVQQGKSSGNIVETSSLPSGLEELGGYRWLPRIIAKAQAKFRGEMSSDIMYGCGADRPFLRKVGIHPAKFLRLVWKSGGDEQVVLEAIKGHAQTNPASTAH